jgi:hypothetical protein
MLACLRTHPCCLVTIDTPWELLEELERRYRVFLKDNPKVSYASWHTKLACSLADVYLCAGLRGAKVRLLGPGH